MGLLNEAPAWLNGMLQAATTPAAGETVSYQRVAGGPAVALAGVAWVGRTLFARRDPTGIGPAVEWGDRDYLVPVTALSAVPAPGDRFTHTVGAVVTTYEVMPGLSEPAWRYSDEYQTAYRIHTKQQAQA